jgi:hypothetical protein
MKRQCAVMRGGTAVELAARTARRRGRDAVVPREPRVAGAGPRRPSPPASAFRGSRDRFVQRIELPYSEVALTSQQRHAQRRYKDRIGVLCPTSTSRTAQSRSMATPRRSHAYAAAATDPLGPASYFSMRAQRPTQPATGRWLQWRAKTGDAETIRTLSCAQSEHTSRLRESGSLPCPSPSARRMEMGAQPHPSPSDQHPPPNRHPRGRQPRRQRRAHDTPHPHA